MNNIKNYLPPPVAALLLGIFLGTGWAYLLSKEGLEIKAAIRNDPATNFAAALTFIGNTDGEISPKDSAIIQALVNQKYAVQDQAQLRRIMKIIKLEGPKLGLQEIIQSFIKFPGSDINLLLNAGMIMVGDDGVFPQEMGTLVDIMNYAGIKKDANW
jgi:hypothetical protein